MIDSIIFHEVSTAIASIPSETPSICVAFQLLGIHAKTVAKSLGISSSQYSLWRTGRKQIPTKQLPNMLGLLEDSITSALIAVGNRSMQDLSPADRTAFSIYQRKVQQARNILQELKDEHR